MSEHQHHLAGSSPLLSWLPLLLLALITAGYLAAVARLPGRRGQAGRAISFAGGMVLLGLGLSPPLSAWAHADFRGHMAQHLLVGMLAPLGLALGAPVSLALKLLPTAAARKLTALLGSTGFHWLSHPVTALLLNTGGMYLLYLTPLYKATFTYPALHHLVHIHFLLAGYLFTWAIAGPDPAPRRPGLRTRILVLFLSMAAHAYLSKFMYAYLYPRLSPHPAGQIQSGAQLMYYGGDLAEMLLAIVLFAAWYRKQRPLAGIQPTT